MEEQPKRRRGLLILIPIALLLLYALIGRDEEPPAAPPPPKPEDTEEVAVIPEAPVVPEPEPVVAAAEIAVPEPIEQAPKVEKAARPTKVPKVEAPPPAEEPAPEQPVEEPPPEEQPPAEEPEPAEPVIQQDEPPKEPATGGVMVLFEDDLAFVRPTSVQVSFDGAVAAVKPLKEGEGEDPITVHTGDLQVGTHTLDLNIKLIGDGGGFFSYVDSYEFTVKQHAVFTLKETENVRIFIKTVEKSATDTWENRVGLR